MKGKTIRSTIIALTAVLHTAALVIIPVSGAHAAFMQKDVLIKGAGQDAAVYYLANDGRRYVFPSENTYRSWFSDFSGVVEVSVQDLASFRLGANVTYRPGVRMVKITTDPKVYAVDKGGLLRWVVSEDVARSLYGSDWNAKIDDISDAFFVDYRIGDPIRSVGDFDPTLVATTTNTINDDRGLPITVSTPSATTSVQVGDATIYAVTFVNSTVNLTNITNITNGGSALPPPPPPSCSTDVWSCGAWDACSDGLQQRSCVMISDCQGVSTPSPVTLQNCSLPPVNISVGGVTVTTGSAPSNLKVGELGLDAKVATFRLTENTGNEAVLVQTIILRNSGSLGAGMLTNFSLKQSGDTLATSAGVNDSGMVVFNLSAPFRIERSASHSFEVFCNISSAADPRIDTIRLSLGNQSDLVVVGELSGSVVPVINDYTITKVPTLNIIDNRLTITFNSPDSVNVAPGANDAELFNFTLASQTNLEIRKTTFSFAGTLGPNGDLSDIKLVETSAGAIVSGPMDYANLLVFKETYNVAAGHVRTFKLTADINKAAPDGRTVIATLEAFTPSADVRSLDNSQYLGADDFIPNAYIAGSEMTAWSH